MFEFDLLESKKEQSALPATTTTSGKKTETWEFPQVFFCSTNCNYKYIHFLTTYIISLVGEDGSARSSSSNTQQLPAL